MKARFILSILIAITFFQGCMPVAKLIIGLRNPKVISIQEAENYLEDTKLYEGETYYLNVNKEKVFKDTSIINEYKRNIKFAFNTNPMVFDSSGNRLNYIGESTCSGTQVQQLYDSLPYFYKKQDNIFKDFNTLGELCEILQTKGEQKTNPNLLPKSNYYIVQKWNTFSQYKKRVKEDFLWYSSMQEKSKYNFHIIHINTDLQENWGLRKGAKFRINKNNKSNRILDKRWKELKLNNP